MKSPNLNESRSFYRNLKSSAVFYAVALGLAYTLKSHYSAASPEQLAWILAPTAKVTETLFRIPFEFETGTGHICRERGIIIAPACAGVNFMIMCFSVSIFPFIHRFGKRTARCAWFSVSVAVAFTVAISVNAFRIFLSLHLLETDISLALQDPEKLHRIGGIVVYLGTLYILYSVLEKTADALGSLEFFKPPSRMPPCSDGRGKARSRTAAGWPAR